MVAAAAGGESFQRLVGQEVRKKQEVRKVFIAMHDTKRQNILNWKRHQPVPDLSPGGGATPSSYHPIKSRARLSIMLPHPFLRPKPK